MPAPAKPLGPTEVIAPAFERAKAQLFAPFRWGFWWRMAIVALFAGEIGGGGFNINIPSGGFPQRTGRGDHLLLRGENPLLRPELLPWIATLIIAIVVLFFVFLYAHSIFRFILFQFYNIKDLVEFFAVMILKIIHSIFFLPTTSAWQDHYD